MTKEEREEAIKELIAFKDKSWDGMPEEVIDVAIEALKQEPCEDCISRAQALSDYANWYGYGYRDNAFYKHLCSMPPVTPQQKVGHWIATDEEPHEDYECYGCGYTISIYTANIEPHMEYKYCPNCGAKMQEVEE